MFGAIRGQKRSSARVGCNAFSSSVNKAVDERLCLSLVEVSALLRSGKLTSVELTKLCLAQIEATNDTTKAYLHVLRDSALTSAAEADARYALNSPLSMLDGIPISVKDNFCIEGTLTTAGSQIQSTFQAPYTATVVTRLLESGAVIIGKTNMDEFGMGSFGMNSSYSVSTNPLDKERTSGGSSSGAAASIASHTCFAAVGSDTGGSVRLPAAYTGLTGLKPTYGNLSRYGLIAYGSSFDCPGLLTKTPQDMQTVYPVVQGADPKDSTCILTHNEETSITPVLNKLRIGILKQTVVDAVEPVVQKAFQAAVTTLQQQGIEIVVVDLPEVTDAIATYYTIVPAEAVSNQSRYDGIRYGPSTYHPTEGVKEKGATNTITQQVDVNALQSLYTANRSGFFGEEVQKRINVGNFVLSSEHYNSYVGQAMKIRTKISNALQSVLTSQDAARTEDQVDAILLPSSTGVAPTFADIQLKKQTQDPSLYADDMITVLANLAGIPAISVPVPSPELPVGVQFMGNALSEHTLLALAQAVQKK